MLRRLSKGMNEGKNRPRSTKGQVCGGGGKAPCKGIRRKTEEWALIGKVGLRKKRWRIDVTQAINT